MNMAGDLAALDRRIAAAVDRFLQQVDKHRGNGLPDRERIEAEFLGRFGDGDPDRTEDIVAKARGIASAMVAFDLRISSLAPRLVNLLMSRDMLAYSATIRAHIQGREAALRILDALPVLTWLEKLRKGQDPGPLPRRPDPIPSAELSARFDKLSSEVFIAGTRVATAVETMADIIDLRLAYLHRLKLNHLELQPEEITERIAQRLKEDPGSRSLQAGWGLLKDTVGERIPTASGGIDLLYDMAPELRRQEEVLNQVYDECEAVTGEFHTLAVAIVSEANGGTATTPAPAIH
jgi:hypothetical protein